MKTILITGATGFIGSHLLQELVKDFKVKCLIRQDLKFKHPNVILIKGDLHSEKAIRESTREVSAIIHLAAIKYNTKDAAKIRKVNVGGTINLLKNVSGAHFIYGSTWLAAYPQKTGLYGLTKNKAEEAVKKSGADYTILRLPHIFSHKKSHQIFIRYILPVYLRLRYGVKPIYQPIEVTKVSKAIKRIINNEKFYRKSFYVVDEKTLQPII